MDFIKENWAVIASILFGLSELLALIPAVKSNSVLQLIVNTVKGLLSPTKPQV